MFFSLPSTPKSSDQENDSPLEEPLQNKAESSDSSNSRHDENQTVENNTLGHDKASAANNDEIKVSETTVNSPREAEPEISIIGGRVSVVEKNKKTKSSIRKLSQIIRKPPVLLTFESQEHQKHVYGNIHQSPQNRQNIPPPPSYYPRSVRNQQQNRSNNDIHYNRFHTPQPNDFTFGHIFINPSYWCPYPTSVPPHTPACLAHLVEVDALFVIKNFEILEFLTGFSEPDLYFIQNKHGECLYYAYEMYDYMSSCCHNRRNIQLILKDIYQNEVIYMNKFCGCNNPCFFCCYPVMEVYAPPSVPVGAIIRVCESSRDDYIILDANENKIFRIRGSFGGNFFPSCSELRYTIHALDNNGTIVGYIKRQYGDFRTYALDAEISGISFPSNLDVRIKSIFLGALMLIQITYFH